MGFIIVNHYKIHIITKNNLLLQWNPQSQSPLTISITSEAPTNARKYESMTRMCPNCISIWAGLEIRNQLKKVTILSHWSLKVEIWRCLTQLISNRQVFLYRYQIEVGSKPKSCKARTTFFALPPILLRIFSRSHSRRRTQRNWAQLETHEIALWVPISRSSSSAISKITPKRSTFHIWKISFSHPNQRQEHAAHVSVPKSALKNH